MLADQGTPVLLNGDRMAIGLTPLSPDGYNEAMLREALHACPSMLPLAELEARHAGARLYSLCTEFPLRSESLDNLLITEDGHPVLVECKLHRNAEARRKVVAQLLGYAEAMHGMSVRAFTDAIARRLRRESGLPLHAFLPEGAVQRPDRFIGQLAHALRHGDFDTVILTDESRAEAQALAAHLRRFPGLGARLHVVEARVYRLHESMLLVPTLATRIDRDIVATVRVENGSVAAITGAADDQSQASRPELTQQEFDGLLGQQKATLPIFWGDVRSRLEAKGVRSSIRRAEILTFSQNDRVHGIAEIHSDGAMRFNYALWKQPSEVPPEVPLTFIAEVADVAGGEVKTSGASTNIWLDDRVIRLTDIEGHAPQFIACVERYLESLRAATTAQSA